MANRYIRGNTSDVLRLVAAQAVSPAESQAVQRAADTAALGAAPRAVRARTGERHRHSRSSRGVAGACRRPCPSAPQSQPIPKGDGTFRGRIGTAARLAGGDVQSDAAAPPRYCPVLG